VSEKGFMSQIWFPKSQIFFKKNMGMRSGMEGWKTQESVYFEGGIVVVQNDTF